MPKKFTTAAKARTAIEFELDEVLFKFTPPKQAAMIMPILDGGNDEMAVVRAGLGWLEEGLADEQYGVIVQRLKDPKDDYDLDDFQELIEWLIEQVGNDRPIL
jgi:hypothetical protein